MMASEYLKDFKTILNGTYKYMLEKMGWDEDEVGAIFAAINSTIGPVYKTFDTGGEAVSFRKEMLGDILDFISEQGFKKPVGSPYPFIIPYINDFFHIIGYLQYQIRAKKDDARTIGEQSWPAYLALYYCEHNGQRPELYHKIECVCHTIRDSNPHAGHKIDKIKDNTPEFWWVVDVLNEKYTAWEKYVHEKWGGKNEK